MAAACGLSTSDEAWLAAAIAAWGRALVQTARARAPENLRAIIFDSSCQLTSWTAMTGGANDWTAEMHAGSVDLPGGSSLAVQVTSFAAPDGLTSFFVMAAPSVWESQNVKGGDLTLGQLTTAVLLHEASHVLQFPTYGRRISDLVAAHQLDDGFSDDTIQQKFEANEEFTGSVSREVELLMAASYAAERDDALRLVEEARQLTKKRHERWFRDELAYLSQAEDLWLTLEGSGQWLGYHWLIDRQGGGLSDEMAVKAFGLRGKSWSQRQGFAAFAALARLAPGIGEAEVFGEGERTLGALLDSAAGDEFG